MLISMIILAHFFVIVVSQISFTLC